jgi:hypothetical protein
MLKARCGGKIKKKSLIFSKERLTTMLNYQFEN